MNQIFNILLKFLTSCKNNAGKFLIILMLIASMIYVAFFNTSCVNLRSHTSFSADSLNVKHVSYDKSDSIHTFIPRK